MAVYTFQLREEKSLMFGKYMIYVTNVGTTKVNFTAFNTETGEKVTEPLNKICEELLGIKFIGNGIFSLKPIKLVIDKKLSGFVDELKDVSLRPVYVPDFLNLAKTLNNRVYLAIKAKKELEEFNKVEKFTIGEFEVAVINSTDNLLGKRVTVTTTRDGITYEHANKLKALTALIFLKLKRESLISISYNGLDLNTLKLNVNGWEKSFTLSPISADSIIVGNLENIVNRRVNEIEKICSANECFIKAEEINVKYKQIKNIVEKV